MSREQLFERSQHDAYFGSLVDRLNGGGDLTLDEWTRIELFEAGYSISDLTPPETINALWAELSARRQFTENRRALKPFSGPHEVPAEILESLAQLDRDATFTTDAHE